MRKIIKPEDIRRDKRVVKIPDVDFEFEPIPMPVLSENDLAQGNVIDGTAPAQGENIEAAVEGEVHKADGEGGNAEAVNVANATEADVVSQSFEQAPVPTIQTVLTEELREELKEEIRQELLGELGRKKISAQKEISIMQRDAKMESEAIIAQAHAEKEQMLSDASEKASQILSEAYQEGIKKGFEEKKTLLDNLAIYISNSIEEIKRERNEFFEAYAKELKVLAIDICEKIISHKIDEDDMIMYGVIKDAVRYVRDTKWVKAEVSRELSGYVDSLEAELKTSGQNVEFIFSDGIPKDSVIMNTSNGLVVATVSEQIKNLREFIVMLDKGDSDESKP